MPKVRTQINCPNCRMPIAAEIEQVYDVGLDPSAKSRLLSGQFNIANCPNCGYHGNLSTPLVYHDHSKELLLTFVPPELNLPQNEREKVIGGLINQVVDALPQEQRKGYLFSPQQTLTLQGLVERILQEDGITKEMIEAQQKRMDLIQRLASAADLEAFEKIAKEEDENIDQEFYTLLSRLVESTLAQGDQNAARQLTEIQQNLLPVTTFGREMQAHTKEIEAAVEELQKLGEGLTREKLLELILNAPNEIRLNAYVSLARPGFDYEFFTLLSGKIEKEAGEEKQRLEKLREQLLEMTKQIDEQIQARLVMASENLNLLIGSKDIRTATIQNLAVIDDYFIQALNIEVHKAREEGDKDREEKLMQVVAVLNEASQAAAGPDTRLLQELIDADEEGRKKIYEERGEEINAEFVEALTGLLVQLEAGKDQEMTDKVRAVYREAVRHSMKNSMKA